jgi:hypothetical protein
MRRSSKPAKKALKGHKPNPVSHNPHQNTLGGFRIKGHKPPSWRALKSGRGSSALPAASAGQRFDRTSIGAKCPLAGWASGIRREGAAVSFDTTPVAQPLQLVDHWGFQRPVWNENRRGNVFRSPAMCLSGTAPRCAAPHSTRTSTGSVRASLDVRLVAVRCSTSAWNVQQAIFKVVSELG